MIAESLPTEYFSIREKSKAEYFLGVVGFVLIAVVLFFSLLLSGGISFNDDVKPLSTSVTNVTNNSFTVSWKTLGKSEGYIVYGTSPENLSSSAYDNHAPNRITTNYKTTDHTVTITNLSPKTYYYYTIISGKKDFDGGVGSFFEPVKTRLSPSPFLDYYTNKKE